MNICPVCSQTDSHVDDCPEGWWSDLLATGSTRRCPHAVWDYTCDWLQEALDLEEPEEVGLELIRRATYAQTLARRLNGDVPLDEAAKCSKCYGEGGVPDAAGRAGRARKCNKCTATEGSAESVLLEDTGARIEKLEDARAEALEWLRCDYQKDGATAEDVLGQVEQALTRNT